MRNGSPHGNERGADNEVSEKIVAADLKPVHMPVHVLCNKAGDVKIGMVIASTHFDSGRLACRLTSLFKTPRLQLLLKEGSASP